MTTIIGLLLVFLAIILTCSLINCWIILTIERTNRITSMITVRVLLVALFWTIVFYWYF